jgi:hypothetical protein
MIPRLMFLYRCQIDPCSGVMNAPQRVSPEQLPDPWLLDTEGVLSELARIRELALRIPPVRNDIIGPINSVIDGVWDLEQRLRYCLHLHCEGQRAFARQHDKKLAKRQNASHEAHTTIPAKSLASRHYALMRAILINVPRISRHTLSGRSLRRGTPSSWPTAEFQLSLNTATHKAIPRPKMM